MKPVIIDPLHSSDEDWPAAAGLVRRYVEAIAHAGVETMIENVRTQWKALRSAERVFPITINNNEVGGSYVCLPHSAYILYGKDELELVDIGWSGLPLKKLIQWADKWLLKADINKIVHVNNWLLSTNLHGDWTGEDLTDIRIFLIERFPDHILAIRSVDAWSNPNLLAKARKDGWVCLPSRQIWVTSDMKKWRRKNSTKNDIRLLRQTPYKIEDITCFLDGDAERISELYYMLYVGKYSVLNPVFTPEFIRASLETGFLTYRGARDDTGRLVAVAGSFTRGKILTPPIVGYDTSLPISEGLYRISCFLFSEYAEQKNLKLNGSAGASQFKKHRGATREIEYSAIYTKHLSLKRRLTIRVLKIFLDILVVPIMKRKEL